LICRHVWLVALPASQETGDDVGDCVIQAGISVAKGNAHKISAAIRFVYFLT
jgi:hypothetical protein